ncbi:MAG: biotin/lipoyl-containing protein [Candidatus Bathyarchaeia archaeon]
MNKKLFRITINGKTYEVEVEELGSSLNQATTTSKVTSAPSITPSSPVLSSPAPSVASTFTPTPTPTPTAPPKKEVKRDEAPQVATGGLAVSAPMPGKILRVNVKEGDSVSKGDLLLILEAMKMENEIFAPSSGVVKRIAVSPGDSVNTGDLLVLLG